MSVYANRMRAAWTQDPSQVHPDWDRYFRSKRGQVESAAPTAENITEEDLRNK